MIVNPTASNGPIDIIDVKGFGNDFGGSRGTSLSQLRVLNMTRKDEVNARLMNAGGSTRNLKGRK